MVNRRRIKYHLNAFLPPINPFFHETFVNRRISRGISTTTHTHTHTLRTIIIIAVVRTGQLFTVHLSPVSYYSLLPRATTISKNQHTVVNDDGYRRRLFSSVCSPPRVHPPTTPGKCLRPLCALSRARYSGDSV